MTHDVDQRKHEGSACSLTDGTHVWLKRMLTLCANLLVFYFHKKTLVESTELPEAESEESGSFDQIK